jgi:hypothetical protein
MKLLLFIFLMIQFICCKKPHIDYCVMLAKDQSYLFDKDVPPEENKIRRETRKALINENFQMLLNEIKKNGFPEITKETQSLDSCKYYAVVLTLTHICQTDPELFYSPEIEKLFLNELNQGRLDRDLLFTPIKIGSNEIVCDGLKKRIEEVIHSWGMNLETINNLRYKPCD